jgi:adenylate kinase family enzyme
MSGKRANILITGTPGVGKSTIASSVAQAIGMVRNGSDDVWLICLPWDEV